MSRWRRAAPLAALLAVSLLLAAPEPPGAAAATLPSGFRDELVLGELPEPTALRFAADGRAFVAEKTGRIVVFDGLGDTSPTTFADLRTDVYDANDRGLLGLAVDPGFPARPYVYALYTYDHVLGAPEPAPEWGEPNHSGDECLLPPGADVNDCPVSGRLVRLTAAEGGAADHAVEDGDGDAVQEVLVEGWCQQFLSHSIGDLRFGPDGSLYASGGDGASFEDADYGQFGWPQKNTCGDPPGPVGASLAPPGAEGGALRAQDARTPADPTGLNGSVIRIDPDSGEGLPGNPMFSSPDANARRIVAFGFRNPFRFAIDPVRDEVYVGNVGWNAYEEIDRFAAVPAPAYNSGWPCYEGPSPNPDYLAVGLDLCADLYAEDGPEEASPPFFFYRHRKEAIPEDECREGIESGSAVSGIAVYRGGEFPPEYEGALFFADSVRGCVYVMPRGGDGRPDPLATTNFLTGGGLYPGIDLEVGPDGALYYVKLFGDTEEGTIHRVSYEPDAPVAVLDADVRWGPAPLTVHLDASASTDPDGEPLAYEWDLDGDGDFEASGQPERTIVLGGDENVTVSVRVSDAGKSNVARVTLFPGDTPPQPLIDDPAPSLLWRVGQTVDFQGHAVDEEEAGESVPSDRLYWKLRLYHCPAACHAHPRLVFPSAEAGSFVAPDHEYPSHLELTLTATDARGLAVTEAVQIYPRTVDLRIESDPGGVELGAGLLSQGAPYSLRVIEGSHLALAAPPEAVVGGAALPWSSWSDGGARVHTIVADAAATYTASYAGPARPEPSPPRPPRSRLLERPSLRTHRAFARFAFAADPATARFQCWLDRGPYRSCRSPRVYRHLRPGRHVFRVRAVDGEGTVEREPPVFRWKVLPPHRRR